MNIEKEKAGDGSHGYHPNCREEQLVSEQNCSTCLSPYFIWSSLSDNGLADNSLSFFAFMYASKKKWIWPNNLKHDFFFQKDVEHKLMDRDFNLTQIIKSHLRKKEGWRSSKTNVGELLLWKKY